MEILFTILSFLKQTFLFFLFTQKEKYIYPYKTN